MFKKRRGIKLSYNKQGLIYFICMNYKEMPVRIQKKISLLCDEVGKEYANVLFLVMTSEKSIRTLAREHYISESLLYSLRKTFYEKWSQY